MDYGIVIQHNRTELFKNLAVKNKCEIVESYPVMYMDLRPYIYSSTVFDFDIDYLSEMFKGIHYNKLPSIIYLGESECNRDKIEALIESGSPYEQLPVMISNSERLTETTEKDELFKSVHVKSDEALSVWCRVLASGLFDNPTMDLKPMIQLYTHALNDPRYILALGYTDDMPISTGIGYISKLDDQLSVGGIFMIATLESHRGKGYGSKLTYNLSKDLLDRGVSFTILDATEMGESIYAKMGYRPVGHSYRFFPNDI